MQERENKQEPSSGKPLLTPRVLLCLDACSASLITGSDHSDEESSEGSSDESGADDAVVEEVAEASPADAADPAQPMDLASDDDAAAAQPPAGAVEVEDELAGAEPDSDSDSDDSNGEEVNRGGRPQLVNPSLEAKSWPGAVAAKHTLGALLTQLFGTMERNNLTDAAARDMFDLVRQHLPVGNTLPRLAQANRMLINKLEVKAKQFVTCPSDCWMAPKALVDMTASETTALMVQRCPECQLSLTDAKGRWCKVSMRE